MRRIAIIVAAVLALAGCAPTTNTKTVTIAVYDSFVMSDKLVAKFEEETGYQLEIVKLGDAGQLTNKLVITKNDPIADAFFGIDNTFAGVATSNGIVDGDVSEIDYADVCFNYDKSWFADHNIAAPTNWQSLTQSTYRGLTVVENPTTSSTGLAFMLATIGELGEPDWTSWWTAMKANGLKVDAGWEDAYYTDFSGSAGKGDYPIVLSYSSSPADESNTAAILDGCFRQNEYAGVLKNAKNVDGAKALVKFMQGMDFQVALPGAMYVYPSYLKDALPESWRVKAPHARSYVDISGLDIEANRNRWLDEWTAAVQAG